MISLVLALEIELRSGLTITASRVELSGLLYQEQQQQQTVISRARCLEAGGGSVSRKISDVCLSHVASNEPLPPMLRVRLNYIMQNVGLSPRVPLMRNTWINSSRTRCLPELRSRLCCREMKSRFTHRRFSHVQQLPL